MVPVNNFVVVDSIPRGRAHGNMPPAPISIHPRQKPSIKDSETLKYKLRCEPADPNSSTYYFIMKVLPSNCNDPEQYCDFLIDLKRVINGLGLQGGPARYRLAKDLLKGRHLFDFNSFAQILGPETIPHFEECLRRLGLRIFPPQAASRQLYWMRNATMGNNQTVRDFMGRLQDIIVKMEEVIPLNVDDDDMRDMVLRAVPERYTSRMTNQGFVPEDHTLLELIDLFERYEAADLILRVRGGPRNGPRGRERRAAPQQRDRRGRHGRNRNRFRNHPTRDIMPNRNYNNRNAPFRNTHNGFVPGRFDPRNNRRQHFGNRPNQGGFRQNRNGNRPHGPDNHNNNNFQRRNNNYRRDDGNNRRREEANALDVIREQPDDSSSGSDASL